MKQRNHVRHGGYKHPLYNTWKAMKNRCNNPNAHNFKNYGGRGIKVCERWNLSFGEFLKDVGERPDGTTLDRIENDGNYEPGNVKWSTQKDQAINRRERKKGLKRPGNIRRKERTGERYGTITVIEAVKKEGDRKVYWAIQCDCGYRGVRVPAKLDKKCPECIKRSYMEQKK